MRVHEDHLSHFDRGFIIQSSLDYLYANFSCVRIELCHLFN